MQAVANLKNSLALLLERFDILSHLSNALLRPLQDLWISTDQEA